MTLADVTWFKTLDELRVLLDAAKKLRDKATSQIARAKWSAYVERVTLEIEALEASRPSLQ